ncbi:MAG: class I SAM-dependent methyltransferase, partial [Nanoarchaeota archaeon]
MAKDYYNSNEIGEKIGLPGAGIIGIILGDQLHPPMVNSKRIWKHGKNWEKGAVMCTKRLADMAKLKKTDLLLDVGCGVGGPAIILARDYKCRIVGLNSSKLQLKTAKEKTKVASLENLIDYVCGDAENLPFSSESFTCVWTFNMFYHINDKQSALEEFYRVLRYRGRLAFDDWVITERATKRDIEQLQNNWMNK